MQPHTYRLALGYDGRAFAGYARQPGLPTVEGVLRPALLALLPDLKALAVAGRTDRGVSAEDQVVSFRSRLPLPLDRLRAAIEAQLTPQADTIQVRSLRRVPRSFHAQWSARARRYRYLAPPCDAALAARVDRLLLPLLGRRDFGAFCRDTPPGKPTVRRLVSARAQLRHVEDSPTLAFELCAEGFLRRQVRVLVATALHEARAGAPDDRLLQLAEAADRRQTQPPAPPEPLRLAQIHYDPV